MIFILFFVLEEIGACFVKNCETCSIQNPKICINCDSGYTRDRALGCIQSQNTEIILSGKLLIENCASYSNNTSCEACFEGYSLINNRCSPICKENCSCFEPNECLSNNSLNPTSCLNCAYCVNTVCTQCYTGYYLSGGYCYSCPSECTSCNGPYTCTGCDTGYYLSGGYCYSCSSECSSCTSYSTCTGCDTGYYLSGGYCYSCSYHCNSCTSYSTCTQCNANYYLTNNYCCDLQCSYCSSDQCYSCKAGYYESGGYCYSCFSNCNECDSNGDCYDCADGYSNENGYCEKYSKNPIAIIVSLLFVLIS